MAYIKIRKKSDGTTRYTAIVRKRVGKTMVHQEAKTFTHRSAALTWAKHREVELENPRALNQKEFGRVTLAELIRWYIETFETISKWQRSKQSHLEFLERHSIGQANVFELTPAALFAQKLHNRTAAISAFSGHSPKLLKSRFDFAPGIFK